MIFERHFYWIQKNIFLPFLNSVYTLKCLSPQLLCIGFLDTFLCRSDNTLHLNCNTLKSLRLVEAITKRAFKHLVLAYRLFPTLQQSTIGPFNNLIQNTNSHGPFLMWHLSLCEKIAGEQWSQSKRTMGACVERLLKLWLNIKQCHIREGRHRQGNRIWKMNK